MNSPDTPRPLLAVIAALVAHVAYLLAPDMVTLPMIVVLHLVAIINTALVFAWLKGVSELTDSQQQLRAILAGCIADVLLFVGAGYCTAVEPGVIKLAGVLPLGWSCAVVSMWEQVVRSYGCVKTSGEAMKDDSPWISGRWLLILGMGTTLVERLVGSNSEPLRSVLALALVVSFFRLWRCYRQVKRQLIAKKD